MTPVRLFGGAAVLVLAFGCGGGSSHPAAGTGGTDEGGQGGTATGGKTGSGGKGGAGASGTGGAPQRLDSGAADAEQPTSADAAGDTAAPGDGAAVPAAGLGPWTGKDNVPPSPNPPGGLAPAQVPMFVSLGFDDNPYSEGMNWAVSAFSAVTNPPGKGNAATFDGTPARATFYHSSTYTAAAGSWKAAYNAGFETGDHTVHHYHGSTADMGMNFSEAGWTKEIQGCIDYLTGGAVGVKRAEVWGFRTPFLQYNANVFPAVKALDFWYDCSIEEGHQEDQDGTNYLWPYTLDHGSPGNATHPRLTPITTWPAGLWEMPAYRVIVPPDADAAKYGVPAGLRAKLRILRPNGVGIAQGKITGLDYNLWYDYNLNKAEFVATLKYTLDTRLRGNRAPLLFGMHSAIYTGQEATVNASLAERKAAIVEFLNYAVKQADVRIVTTKAVLDWIRNPVPL
ncbi:MAG TPA: hypothetical protein VN914_16405 [Polyangia bacterium]|nr:hypothetical protein [Polyangia bacterium]